MNLKKLLLIVVFAATAFGQSEPEPLPPDVDNAVAGGVNFMKTVIDGSHDLVTAVAPSIMPFAWGLLGLFGAFALLQTQQQAAIRMLSQHWVHPLAGVMAYIAVMFRIVMATIMMTFYSTPIPGFPFSFSELFPYLGQALASSVTMDLLKQVLGHFADAVHYLPPVGMFQFLPGILTMIVLLLIGVGEFAMTFMTAGSYAVLGVFTIAGPLCIPYYVLPNHEKKFWNWLDNIITISSYSFISACFIYIFCHSYLDFFFNLHDFSVGQWLVSIGSLLLITLSFLWAMFKVPTIAHAIFGGLADIAQGFASGVQMATVGLVAKALK